ncbi:hypothetical protein Tco_0269146 [Tanacetum coccineum]
MTPMLWLQNSLQLRRPQLGRLLTQEKLPPAPLSKRLTLNLNSRLMTFQYQMMCISQTQRTPMENKKIGKSKLVKADLEGPAYKLVKPFPKNSISLQFQMEECHLLLTDHIYLMNHEGDKERRNALTISKLKAANYPDFRLEELFKRKEFHIIRHNAPSNRSAVRSHMKILSVVSLKTFSRYGYTYLKEIVLRRADYKDYKISEAYLKNLHPKYFEDLYLLHLQGKLNQLSGADKVHLFNAVNLWIRNIVIRQRVEELQLGIPRAVIYKDRNNQNKMMRETEVHKFSDGTLTRILEKLDVMVKDYVLFKFNPVIEHRIWFEDDKRRSQEFIKLIQRMLKIRQKNSGVLKALLVEG